MADELHALVFDVETPRWGWVGLVASARGLRLLTLPSATSEAAWRRIRRHYPQAEPAPDDPMLLAVAEQVRAYLAGQPLTVTAPLDLQGHMSFELAVWAAASRIPYGQTRTYAWIAEQAGGAAGAAQAAGAALGDNPVPLIIPCHRVIGSDGELHGFAGGLEMKVRLLAMESGQPTLGLEE